MGIQDCKGICGIGTGVAELERQLAAAQRSVARLTQENERLMEISNELRAKRHKHERAAAQTGELSYMFLESSSFICFRV